jgi:hypothetical protein
MAFLLEYLAHYWERTNDDKASLKEWQDFLTTAEQDRQRE